MKAVGETEGVSSAPMFTWLMRLLGRDAPKSAEEEAAYQEAKTLRYDIETLRTGDLSGPPMYTHSGREGRGH